MSGMVCASTITTRDGEPLRILAIHRYFWPDTPPYATMLRAIAERWSQDGHDVEVLSTQPSYKKRAKIEHCPSVEDVGGIRVRRITLPGDVGRNSLVRIFNIFAFAITVVWYALTRPRFDVIMASTAPPVFVGAAARIAARLRGAKFVYHCMDLHPEIGRISGEFRNPWLYALLQRIDTRNCLKAERVIVLSKDMEQTVLDRPGASGARIEIINNFSLSSFVDTGPDSVPDGLEKPPGHFRILFAGNIGRFQGLESVVKAVSLLRHRSNLELVFLGEGKAVDELGKCAGDLLGTQVRFFPHQPTDVARAVIRTADLCLVSLAPEIYKYAYPSKTMTYLCEGRPLLVSIERSSELARFVKECGVGIVVHPEDPVALADRLGAIIDNADELHAMSERAARTGQQWFDRDKVLDRWSRLIKEIGEGC